MTEMELLKVFNDIEDKFVDEEIEGEAEPLAPVTVNPNKAKNRFFWVKYAGIAAACALVAGGLVYLKNNPNLAVDPSVTEGESSVQNTDPELGANSTLYQTKLNCNNNSYDVRIFLTEIDEEKSLNDENYIWGEAAMELSLNGEVLDTVEIYENSYLTSAYGTPFDRETLGSDYFKVISMEQDVLAFISPNAAMHNVVLDNNYGALLNARFFTVNKEGKIAPIKRYATEEEKKKIDAGTEAWIEPAYLFFKITPDYGVEENRLILHLDRQVVNPWWVNGTVYEKGDIPLSFDFENYTLTCENDDYKHLIYNAVHIFDSVSDNITLLDGTFAKEEDIKELRPNPNNPDNNPEAYDYFTANVVFAVPFFTPMEGRTPWRAGDWIKLKAGDTIGGFTVVNAESYYILPSGLYFPAGYVANVELEGNLSCTATAEKDYKLDGTSYTGNVKITLDRESCEKLFSLSFNSGFNRSFDEERICFFLPESENDELFHALCVQGRESVKIKIEADSFAMRYTHETGNSFDNQSIISLTDSDYSIELAEEEKAVTEKDKLNEKIYNAVASAKTVEELTQNLSPYRDSFYRFAVYSVYYPGNPNNSIVIKSGKLRDGMVCIIYYDESEKNVRGIPIIKKTDEKLILMDGSIATEEDIKEIHPNLNDPETIDYFTINAAFAVPFLTPAEGRTPGEPGEWIKLRAGDKIGDFTVVSADSIYVLHFPYGYEATVELKGNLSCTGTAEKAYGIDGTLYNDCVEITLDRESCEKLFSLSFNSELYDEDFDEERIRFFLPVSENDELYNALLVQNKESVRIKLEADSFKLRYTYETGNMYDGWSTMNLNGSDYSIEIVEGKNLTLMDGSAAADDEILSEDEKTFTVNSCFAVPFSTVNGNRQAGEKGDWIKLKEGDTFGDYTVESAESTYTKPSEGVFPPYKSKVILLGKLSCTGTAKIIPSPTGYDGLVELTLDEDCCQKLMNLAPCLDNDFSDSTYQDRIYMWMTYKTKDYQPIIDELQNTESVRVKLETEHFSLDYQYGSEYWYDGKVMLNSVGNEHSLEIISE